MKYIFIDCAISKAYGLTVKFLGSQKFYADFQLHRGGLVVQGSTACCWPKFYNYHPLKICILNVTLNSRGKNHFCLCWLPGTDPMVQL